jgi:hypothetical protein
MRVWQISCQALTVSVNVRFCCWSNRGFGRTDQLARLVEHLASVPVVYRAMFAHKFSVVAGRRFYPCPDNTVPLAKLQYLHCYKTAPYRYLILNPLIN